MKPIFHLEHNIRRRHYTNPERKAEWFIVVVFAFCVAFWLAVGSIVWLILHP